MDNWKGKTLFAGTYFASFFLIYRVIQAIMERAIFSFSQSRFADAEEHKMAVILNKIESMQDFIKLYR